MHETLTACPACAPIHCIRSVNVCTFDFVSSEELWTLLLDQLPDPVLFCDLRALQWDRVLHMFTVGAHTSRNVNTAIIFFSLICHPLYRGGSEHIAHGDCALRIIIVCSL